MTISENYILQELYFFNPLLKNTLPKNTLLGEHLKKTFKNTHTPSLHCHLSISV